MSVRPSRMWALALVLALLAGACGDGGGSDVGDGSADGGLTIGGLCDPIEDAVLAVTGPEAHAEHFDLFATDEEQPGLICEWYSSETTREIRVLYHGSPDVWKGTPTDGRQALSAVDVENLYDAGILDIHAPNGWTITVLGWEGTTPAGLDAPDELAVIGNAALDAVGS